MANDSPLARALAAHQNGQIDEAEAGYREMLVRDPSQADALHLLGLIEHQRGRSSQALELITAALATAPQHAPARSNLARILAETGDFEKAAAVYAEIVRDRPADGGAWNDLGTALARCGRLDEAAAAFERAAPDRPEAALNRANVLRRARRFDEAEIACRRALERRDDANVRIVLGQTFLDRCRLDEALEQFETALRLDPLSADAHANLGVFWYVVGDARRAIAASERAIDITPAHARAHFNLAISYLLDGRFRDGWREFEWRLPAKGYENDRRYAEFPRWRGERFDGRRLVVSHEQGLGDAIFLARYLPRVASLGSETVVETPGELLPLFRRIRGITAVDVAAQPLPHRAGDVHVPAFSIPGIFNTELDSIPAGVPYLHPSAEGVASWARSLELKPETFNAGVVWAGGNLHGLDAFRSATLHDFAPLFEMSAARWLSLQKGPRESELEGTGFPVNPVGRRLADFDDTAALVSSLDLVITVDTSVAHIAGALGRPVWLLLGLGTDWRWLLDREESLWYPSMRLFRQTEPGRWDGAIRKVAGELARTVRR